MAVLMQPIRPSALLKDLFPEWKCPPMGKMPIIWHHGFGIQSLKSVTTASRSFPAFVAPVRQHLSFSGAYEKTFVPSRYLIVPASVWNFACLV